MRNVMVRQDLKNMEDFRRVVDDCNLIDIGYDGVKYTWCGSREVNNIICERLDRFWSNKKWLKCSQRP